VGDTCAWNAAKYYLSEVTEWPTSVISVDTSVEAREKALREGPYGRCAFKTDNSAVDHQVVSGEYESGASLGFSVIANSFLPYRTIRVIGTKAELNGNFESNSIVIRPLYMGGWWPEKKDRVIEVQMLDGGHGGGDTGVLREFCRIVRENDMESSRASLRLAVEGHLLSFAAEKARAESEVVHMSSFRKVLDEETSPALA
jgi:hypothetical protein